MTRGAGERISSARVMNCDDFWTRIYPGSSGGSR